jgi:hypothetical protein
MKTISKFILAILSVSFMTVACDDMNSLIQDDLDRGETIYPGRAEAGGDDIRPGINKAWVYWYLPPDSRVDSTIILYTFNGETLSTGKKVSEDENPYPGYRRDSMLIEPLDEGVYTFSVYTVDKDGNRSIMNALFARSGDGYTQSIQIYGRTYLSSLLPRSIDKMEMRAGGNLQVVWTKDTSNVLYSLIEYKDFSAGSSGLSKVDTIFNKADTSILYGFKRFQTFKVTSSIQVGISVVDTIQTFYAPPVVEKLLLATPPNTFKDLTEDAAKYVTTLAYPLGIESWTLQDLYYFENLSTLDLTPGTTEPFPAFTYNRKYADRRSGTNDIDTTRYSSTIGGGPWLHCASGYMTDSDIAIIDSLLASGQLQTVKYTRNSYPKLDTVLAKYNDKVAWLPDSELSDKDIAIPHNLLVDYRVVDRDKGVDIDGKTGFNDLILNTPRGLFYSADGSDFEVPEGLETLNGVYRVQIRPKNVAENKTPLNTVAFAVPPGLQLGLGKLKFDCFIEPSKTTETTGDDYTWLTTEGVSKYESWRTIKVFVSRKLPSAPEDPDPYPEADFPYEAPYKYETEEYPLPHGNDHKGFNGTLSNEWASFEWDLSTGEFFRGHYRVIRIQFGVDGASWPLPANKTLTYYIANLRWSN